VTPAPAAVAGRTIIIGAGQAGLQVAVELRQSGYAGAVTLVGEEAAQPYHRPPLSKAYLTGEKSLDALQMRGQAFYSEQAITFMAGLAATGIDRTARQVVLADGSTLPYDHLVLATGAAARPLSCPGHDLDGVMVLRSLEDATTLKARLATARHLVVVGGGFIGLEAAASARKLGVAVSLLEMQDRLMARAVGPDVSQHFASVHRSHGVDLRLGQGIAAVIGDAGRAIAVRTTAGDVLPADIVLAGIGVTPNTALAAVADLPVSNGIVVDESQRTSDPRVHALGDVCAFPAPHGTGLIRLESVQNAVDQAKVVAASITGQPARYQSVPWFWSDQYDLKLQMVGLSQGHDAVIERGSRDENRFSVFYMKAGRLIAIDSINRPADHMRGRKLLAPGAAPVGADEIDTHFAARRD
jgi:3-phenylpropionate/trans-cinnamate dioxygenase ferredoxin reductase subunit